MMSTLHSIVVFLLLLPLAEATAADWQYMGSSSSEGESFFDAGSVQYPNKNAMSSDWLVYLG